MEAMSGKVIEGENIHLKRPPASVVKLMVALVVAEKVAMGEAKLTDQITVSREASKIGEPGLSEGGRDFFPGRINKSHADCLGK